MAGLHDFNFHFRGAFHRRVEVVNFEPEQHAIAVRPVGRIADAAVMVLDFEAVQLQNEPAVTHQLLVLLSTVSPAATQQAPIPAAARFDIRHADKRLGTHGLSVSENRPLTAAFTIRSLQVPNEIEVFVPISGRACWRQRATVQRSFEEIRCWCDPEQVEPVVYFQRRLLSSGLSTGQIVSAMICEPFAVG